MSADTAIALSNLPNQDQANFRSKWESVKAVLRNELGEDVFTSWFARADLDHVQDDIATISVSTRFLKSWIQSHYRDLLLTKLALEIPNIRSIEFVVRQVSATAKQIHAPVTPTPSMKPSLNSNSTPPRTDQSQTLSTHSERKNTPSLDTSPAGLESTFDQRYTFENYQISKSNAFAHSAALRVSTESIKAASPFNPLYIHGGVGLGKTHLIQAIGHEVMKSGKKVLYLTAERFMYEFVNSLRAQTALSFKESLRGIDLLLMDDLQFLQGKSIQQEFCHVMNTLLESARSIVVAADRLPGDLDNLDTRIRSRLGGGLVVEISMPDEELRYDILKTRASALTIQNAGLIIPDHALRLIASAVATNGRDLEGALNRVVAQHQFSGQAFSEALVEDAIRDLIRMPDNRRIKIEDIQRFVAKHYNVSRADLLSNRRTQTIVRPRQVAMYLAKTLTPRSLPEIGRRFGGRDHTTVLHAVRKIEQTLPNDPSLQNDVDTLKRVLEGQ